MSYYSLLVPLVATVALLIICFILYIFYGEKCCKSQHKGSVTKTFAYGIETLDVPAEEINFTCELYSNSSLAEEHPVIEKLPSYAEATSDV